VQATVITATLTGVDALPVEVQADVGRGLPSFSIVGLPDAAVQEARDRVRAAIRASGFEFPNAHVLVNLAPAPLRKHGTGFDLPIALAILTATRQISPAVTRNASVVGELSLDGSVRPVSGLLAYAIAASRAGLELIGPPAAGRAAGALTGLTCRVMDHLQRVKRGLLTATPPSAPADVRQSETPDLTDVVGHAGVRRALEIAAAGGHSLLLVGPPGAGKTLLARRLPGILPQLDAAERLETALVHSVAGLDERPALAGIRPFRAPHHTCTVAGLVGGGSPPHPGEMSLAHNGVLFLDEFAEFGPSVLQALRQPLEDGTVTLVRAEGRTAYPCRFSLVAAMNPCPCGYLGDPHRSCTCLPSSIDRYRGRIGGPLFDRLDIRVRVNRVDSGRLLDARPGEDSASVRRRVVAGREYAAQTRRTPTRSLSGAALTAACALTPDARGTLDRIAGAGLLSGRGLTRVLRVARTIADLENCSRVERAHLTEAIGYRAWDTA
jgi:magnesium chelatase family protein